MKFFMNALILATTLLATNLVFAETKDPWGDPQYCKIHPLSKFCVIVDPCPHGQKCALNNIASPVRMSDLTNMPMKHNMVLFGENQIFASHIVYKSPHNYQVILKLNFTSSDRDQYLNEKKSHPHEQFIFLLDPMDIGEIALQSNISGTVFWTDQQGQNHNVISKVILNRSNFEIIYFDELPLSLQPDHSMAPSPE